MITIDQRYRGPSRSGNGGFSCGVIAEAIGGPAQVRLHAPPPLDTPMTLEQAGDRWELRAGETLIGSGAPADVTVEPPPPPSLDEATEAVARYAGRKGHIFPECFVCGVDRGPPDALGIHPGPIGPIVAAPWRPPVDFATAGDRIRPAVVWAALDCPSYFGLQHAGLQAVLGTLSAEILEAPRPEEPCIVVGWGIRSEGRKHHAGAAVHRADGTLLAKASALWIELRDPVVEGGVAGT